AAADFYLCRYQEGEAHARRGLAIGRTTGQGELFPLLTQALGNILFVTGRVEEAGELLDEAVDSARISGGLQGLWRSLVNRSFAALWAGDIKTALRTGNEGAGLGEVRDDGVVGLWADEVLGAVELEAGNAERAVDLMVGAGGRDLEGIPGAWRANWLEQLTMAHLGTGDLEAATRASELSRKRADACDLP